MTIREQIVDVVERNGERVFLVDALTGSPMTYREFHQLACALGAELHSRGLCHGDRLGVMVPNAVNWRSYILPACTPARRLFHQSESQH